MNQFLLPFLVIAFTMLAFVIVVTILGKKGREEDQSFKRKKNIGKETVKAEYKNVDTTFYERVIKPFVDKITSADKYDENATKTERQKQQTEMLNLQLRKAGLHITASNFRFFKLAFSAVTVILSLGFSAILYLATDNVYVLFIALIGMVIGLLGPNLYLNSRVSSHQKAIKSQLADTIDLMSVCMESGLSFDASLVKIAERMEGPLIDELMTVFRQIQLGKNRNDALKNLADSSDVKELKTFVSAVIQAGQLGIPITNVLQSQAEQLRMNKSEEIKEVASKVPTKMTIPTVLLILPAIILIILGPVIFQVLDSLKDSGMFG